MENLENSENLAQNINTYLPYIVSFLVALISGITSYFAAANQCRTNIKTLEESNAHEIDRLMKQHKLDIDSLERKHQMEVERMELEHRHQLERINKEAENAMNSELMNTVMNFAMQTPEARQAIGSAIREHTPTKRRRQR